MHSSCICTPVGRYKHAVTYLITFETVILCCLFKAISRSCKNQLDAPVDASCLCWILRVYGREFMPETLTQQKQTFTAIHECVSQLEYTISEFEASVTGNKYMLL